MLTSGLTSPVINRARLPALKSLYASLVAAAGRVYLVSR